MSSVASIGSANAAVQNHFQSTAIAKSEKDLTAQEAFQEFVAGTFYKEMLKALRSTQNEPAYFHGGYAENVFQGQLDQTIAEDLARTQGAAFSEPLFSAFSQQMSTRQIQAAVMPAAAK